jgi:hypothetical protein
MKRQPIDFSSPIIASSHSSDTLQSSQMALFEPNSSASTPRACSVDMVAFPTSRNHQQQQWVDAGFHTFDETDFMASALF